MMNPFKTRWIFCLKNWRGKSRNTLLSGSTRNISLRPAKRRSRFSSLVVLVLPHLIFRSFETSWLMTRWNLISSESGGQPCSLLSATLMIPSISSWRSCTPSSLIFFATKQMMSITDAFRTMCVCFLMSLRISARYRSLTN